MNAKLKKIGFILTLISALLLPGMQVLFVIGYNTKYLIRMPFFILVCILNIALIISLIVGITLNIKNRLATNRKLRKWLKVVMTLFMILYITGCIAFITILYGPYDKFRTWLVTTAMGTMNHQYLCKWFYNNDQINDVMSKNYIKESGESTDPNLIQKEEVIELNDFEKELLTHEEGEPYKIVKFEVNELIKDA